MTVTPGHAPAEKVGTPTRKQRWAGRHAALIAYISAVASLLAAIAGILAVLQH
jgi:hypothetical protein